MTTFITPPFRVNRYLGFKLLPSHHALFAHPELATSWLSGCCATCLITELSADFKVRLNYPKVIPASFDADQLVFNAKMARELQRPGPWQQVETGQ
jgi:hypothetical protein